MDKWVDFHFPVVITHVFYAWQNSLVVTKRWKSLGGNFWMSTRLIAGQFEVFSGLFYQPSYIYLIIKMLGHPCPTWQQLRQKNLLINQNPLNTECGSSKVIDLLRFRILILKLLTL